MSRVVRRLLNVLLAITVLVVPLVADAGRRVESVGAVLVSEPLSTPERQEARAAAFEVAVSDAVFRVALELIQEDHSLRRPQGAESGSGLAQGAEPAAFDAMSPDEQKQVLERVLGDNPRQYTNRFELIEDRGVRPRRFVQNGDPNLTSEYVLIARVDVDETSVRRALEQSGLLAPLAAEKPEMLGHTRIVLSDVSTYSIYEAVLETLRERVRVNSVTPVEFQPGVAVLAVESDLAPEAIGRALQIHLPKEFAVAAMQVNGSEIDLRIEAVPAPTAQDSSGDVESSGSTPIIR